MTRASDNVFPKVILVEGSAPSSPAATNFKLFFDSADHLLKWKNSAGTVTTISTGAGGGSTQSYLGYNTVGASFETLVVSRQYMKKITVAATCQLLSVGFYLKAPSVTDVVRLYPVIMSDASGAAGPLIGSMNSAGFGIKNGAFARWVDFPLAGRLTAADYWIGVAVAANGTNTVSIAYDTGGSDPYITGGDYVTDGNLSSPTDSTRQYSMRASILT